MTIPFEPEPSNYLAEERARRFVYPVADPVIVDCDGQTEAYRVLNGHMAYPPTYTPPTGYTGWFVLEDEVIEL